MPTLRAWWKEDSLTTAKFAWQMLGVQFPAGELSGENATRLIWQHLQSPAMWAIFPLQDLLAIDESIRHADTEAERINVPAIMPFYWRYRMHLGIDGLASAADFNRNLTRLIRSSGR
jgi:4-alpha-glucanotransferase